MTTTSRPYTGNQDLERMRALLLSTRQQIGHSCWHIGDLTWRLFLHAILCDLRETVQLWANERDQVTGFAVATPPVARQGTASGTLYFDMQVHPQERGCGLEEQILNWIEILPGARAGQQNTLSTELDVFEDDAAQIEALEQRGFRRTEDEGVLLLRSLSEPIPHSAAVSSLPHKVAIRSLAGSHEAQQRVACHRDAFHSSRITVEAYLRLMQTPGYAREWDLVVVGPDGTIAAFALVWLDPLNKVGAFEPVGTRTAFRRKGLATAVMLDGLRRLQAAGAQSAVVDPIPDREEITLALYHSIGFRPHRRVRQYIKQAPS